MNARVTPLPYNRLRSVFQIGDCCATCGTELIPGSCDVFGNSGGAYCSEYCYQRAQISAAERSLIRGACYALLAVVIVGVLILTAVK